MDGSKPNALRVVSGFVAAFRNHTAADVQDKLSSAFHHVLMLPLTQAASSVPLQISNTGPQHIADAPSLDRKQDAIKKDTRRNVGRLITQCEVAFCWAQFCGKRDVRGVSGECEAEVRRLLHDPCAAEHIPGYQVTLQQEVKCLMQEMKRCICSSGAALLF